MQVLKPILIAVCSMFSLPELCLANDNDRANFPVSGSDYAWVEACCGFCWDSSSNLAPPPDLTVVLQDLNSKLAKDWLPSGCNNSEVMPLKVAFRLTNDGRISNVILRSSSGVAETDNSLINALSQISAIHPLQDGILNLDLTLMFSYEKRKIGKVIIVDTCH